MGPGEHLKIFKFNQPAHANTTTTRQPKADPDDGLLLDPAEADKKFRQKVDTEKRLLQIREVARQEHAANTFSPPESYGTLAEELALPEEPMVWRVQSLLPMGFSLAVVAKYKTGKTTLMLNLLRSLCDGDPFLDEFTVRQVSGRVAYWNYELTRAAFRRWVREGKLANPGRASALHLRGHGVPLLSEVGQNYAVSWLRERDVEVWIVDPFGSAYDGEENSNSDVKRWLQAVESIARRAGVDQTVIVMHAGATEAAEGQERARGATKLGDWPDVRWVYLSEPGGSSDLRFLRAHGRDVDYPEFSVSYDSSTRTLRHDSPHNRRAERLEGGVSKVVDVVAQRPGIGANELQEAISGAKAERPRYITEAIERGLIAVHKERQKNAHYLVSDDHRAHRTKLTNGGES